MGQIINRNIKHFCKFILLKMFLEKGLDRQRKITQYFSLRLRRGNPALRRSSGFPTLNTVVLAYA
jgi:hypothetical protein